ncbi:MAG: DUF349 domain-containing protein [Pseudomonadales bacterium]|jgi:hypothetical protein|nr:DUF349 domain-containing protein [Pseudomonadales bacterium]
MITRIIRSLAGPGLDDPDPTRRIEALDRQDPPLDPQALAELARTDPEPSVRAACVVRIDDAGTLLALMDATETEAIARSRLETLIAGGLDVEALLDTLANVAAVRHLLDAAPSGVAATVLARIDDEEVLAEIAAHHRLAPIRAAAAERVVSEDALRRVARGARERDKEVSRRVRERLDALRDARAEGEAAAARIEQLAGEATPLATTEDTAHLAERLALLRRHRDEALEKLAATTPVLARFGLEALPAPAALTRLDEALAAVDLRLESEQAALAAQQAADAAAEARRGELDGLVDALEVLLGQVDGRIAAGGAVSAERGPLLSALEVEDARWRDATDAAPAPEDVTTRRRELRDRLDALALAFDAWLAAGEAPAPEPVPEIEERLPRTRAEADAYWPRRDLLRARLGLLDGWLGQCGWPDACAAPAPLARVREERDAVATAVTALDDAERRLGERVGKLTTRMERALEAKKLGPVLGMQRDLKRQLETLPAVNERLAQRVEALEQGIDELRDWEYFATAPKREALCEAMEQLAEAEDVEGPARAEQVKSLRTEWNGLGPVRGDEGAALAARFDAAAEKAFAPARVHFEAAAARRAENTEQRRRICDELEQFLERCDWAAADWKAVERIYRSSRDDWKRFEDVDRDGRALGKRYHKLTRTLKRQLEQRWQANIARKEALVASARALVVDGVPVPESAKQAKALQQEWKTVDITPRSVDRTLWQDFRAACDAVFQGISNQRDEAKASHAASREPLLAATRAYGEALEALRARGADALQAADFSALPEQSLRDAMDALGRGNVPPPERKKTNDALRAAKDLLGEARRLRQVSRANARRAALRTALEYDVARTEAEANGGAAPAPPPDLTASWREALARRDGGRADDGERRGACIDLELALGCESPAEDAELRLRRQVELLNSGMRGESAARDDDARIEAAVATLLACPGGGADSVAFARRARAALDAPKRD